MTGLILNLLKAHYGLGEFPLLWQQEFAPTLKRSGFEGVPHEPYCMVQNGFLSFFYVDGIAFTCRKAQEKTGRNLVTQLQQEHRLSKG
jgi:hypothetical protein